jgi:hypothetical protein
MWYLATSEERVPFHEYAELVEAVGDQHSLTLTEGTDAEWVEFALAHKDGDWPIGDLKWIPVRPSVSDDPGAQEIAWFLEEIEGRQPACNVPWLRQFLPQVRTVYSWSLSSGTNKDDGWAPVHELAEAFTDGEETAVYAEFEGWSNTDGDHITWEFTDRERESGQLWWFGLFLDGRWHRFQMDLADRERAAYFRRGEIPLGVKVLVDPAEPSATADPARKAGPSR